MAAGACTCQSGRGYCSFCLEFVADQQWSDMTAEADRLRSQRDRLLAALQTSASNCNCFNWSWRERCGDCQDAADIIAEVKGTK